MAAKSRSQITLPLDGLHKILAFLAPLLLVPLPAAGQLTQPSPEANDNPYSTSVSPALAVIIVAIVSSVFFLAFFTIYLRRCAGDRSAVSPAGLAGTVGGRRRATRGLDPAILNTFPTMVYSEIKKLKIEKETLECAVCLCEFEDDEILRLLPRCDHVFHRDCVDVWLATHVTCPVCRRNLAADEDPSPETDQVAVTVENEGDEGVQGEDRQEELAELVRIGSQRREAAALMRSRSGSTRRGPPATRSAGDWAAAFAAAAAGDGERFRLRLPEDVRQEILSSQQLRRSATYASFWRRREGSSRRGYRDGGGGGWRSLRLGRSVRWWGRSLSARSTGEAAVEASVSGADGGSSKGGTFGMIKGPLTRVDGGSGGDGIAGWAKPEGGETSTARLPEV
ncbi:E3 ubiquitin-protein ligase ATL6 [Apostasia shenzhenica]|uniref:RING-type E3 ubiquitin transferase n=1 Tax=Apostasia shenzhenica TaxID=1088818 RepID=A0A2I0AVC2_9ASPA|nr:E3 ubiquitin-protein ligase ATL6 [Apostasia shenzhenica]